MLKRIDKRHLKNIPAKKIDFGKNEGGLDSLDRFFLDTGEISRLGNDKNTLIIGRKGTGKTAIATYLHNRSVNSFKEFVNLLSFRDIPVALIETFDDQDFTHSGKFVSVWKFILLIELAKLVIKNEALNFDRKQRLEAIVLSVSPNLESSPLHYLKATRQKSFKVDLKVAQLGDTNTTNDTQVELIDYLDSLKEELCQCVHIEHLYCVILDELDDSYAKSPQYEEMLVALFKAAADLDRDFFRARTRLNVFIALRDDIYDSINYSDKNKWDDSAVRIDWVPPQGTRAHDSDIFRMINLRIGASFVDQPDIDTNYWEHAFTNQRIVGKLSALGYILSRTMYRPRDMIEFCKCIKAASMKENSDKFTRVDVLKGEVGYSDWLRKELVDELHVLLPEIRIVFECLKKIKKPIFTQHEFQSIVDRESNLGQWEINDLLTILFDFSIIGICYDRQDAPIFRYRNLQSRFESGQKYSVHYGLRSTLRLTDKDLSHYNRSSSHRNKTRKRKTRHSRDSNRSKKRKEPGRNKIADHWPSKGNSKGKKK